MSGIQLHEADFKYPTSSFKKTGPLRLLRFKPSATNTWLSLSLVHQMNQMKEVEFVAISYAWDRLVCKPCFGTNGDISCETHGTSSWTNNKALCNKYLSSYRSDSDGYMDILINKNKFYVQDTVYHLLLAIKNLRQKVEYFWLDAICINQNDKLEREQQTSNMHEVYKAAQHVYVWLGTAYDSSDTAMDFLFQLREHAPEEFLRPSPFSKRSRRQESSLGKEYNVSDVAPGIFLNTLRDLVPSTRKGPDESEFYGSRPVQSHSQDVSGEIRALLDRPYWKRTWVIQEFLLAVDLTLLCGNREVPWTKAVNLVDRLNIDAEFRKRHPWWNITPGVRIIQARKAFISIPGMPALEDMIHHFLFSRSTYPEDKLIGLLNVSLSNANTDFNNKPGSIEKRVEVINEVVRDIQGRNLDSQTAKAWKYLLACLLGVPHEFPKPRGMSLFSARGLVTPSSRRGLVTPSSRRERGYAATSASCFGRVEPPMATPRHYAATSIPMPYVGSVRP